MNDIDERCHAYTTVARAIRFVRQQSPVQPSLQEIAEHVGMSRFHLQRTFAVWVGISPKRFLQHLSTRRANSALRSETDVLAAAHAAGLSGPGRLHDLMVTCEAVTPGEVRSLGAGLAITYGFGPTPFGRVIAATTERGLCHLQFVAPNDDAGSDDDDDAAAAAHLRADWPRATLIRNDEAVAATIASAFASLAGASPLHLLLRGTNFQLKVWQALLSLAPGEVVTYGRLAADIGQPRAQRAVGSALAGNRIALLIPCHRVIRENGDIGRYRWGNERKQALLAFEAASRAGQASGRAP